MDNIRVQFTINCRLIRPNLPLLKKLITQTCSRFGVKQANISVLITNSCETRRLNRKFLRQNITTDCLSFDLSDKKDNNKTFQLIVNAQRAAHQAKLRKHTPHAELALYITHALLHNLGFADSSSENARKMHKTEGRILQQHGFGIVYNSTAKQKRSKGTVKRR